MQSAGRFNARATGVPSGDLHRFNEGSADAIPAVCFIDHEGGDSAPGARLVRHRYEAERRGAEQLSVTVGDDHPGSGVAEHALERAAKRACGLRMAELVEQTSESRKIVNSGAPKGIRSHLKRKYRMRRRSCEW